MLNKNFTSILIATFVLLSIKTTAQTYFRVGYNLGLYNPREINKVIYIHNAINSNYYASGKDLPEIKTFGGLCFAFGTEWDKNVGWELQWQNKHDIVKSKFDYNGETINRYLKIRSNMLNLGVYGGGDHLAFGGSLDFGNFKGFYKRDSQDTIRKTKYISVFQNQLPGAGQVSDDKDKSMIRTLQIGFTVYTQYCAGPLGVRLFYQFQFMNKDLDNLDNKLLGRDMQQDLQLEDHFNNAGLMLFLKLGGYKN